MTGLLWMLAWGVGAVEPAPVHALDYRVVTREGRGARVEVSVTATGWGGAPGWCPGVEEALPYQSEVVEAARGNVHVLSYAVDLRDMARRHASVDVADTEGRNLLAHDGAFLWRPEELPSDTSVRVTVSGAVPVTAAWEPAGPGAWRMNGESLEGGSYVLFGGAREVPVGPEAPTVRATGVQAVALADIPALGEWVTRSARMVADYNGGQMPVPRTHVILVPSRWGGEAGVFGSTLRWGHGSVVLYYAPGSTPAQFKTDWVAPHELYHLANPVMTRRTAWFIEGITTYYQEVVRVRAGVRPQGSAWNSLRAGIEASCGAAHKTSLVDASASMYRERNYYRVYWGGACVALVLDVALRRQPGGGSSLDARLKALRARSLEQPLDPEELENVLAEGLPAAGWERSWLHAAMLGRAALPIKELYDRLGVSPEQDGPLDDRAPWADTRRSIMGDSPVDAAKLRKETGVMPVMAEEKP